MTINVTVTTVNEGALVSLEQNHHSNDHSSPEERRAAWGGSNHATIVQPNSAKNFSLTGDARLSINALPHGVTTFADLEALEMPPAAGSVATSTAHPVAATDDAELDGDGLPPTDRMGDETTAEFSGYADTECEHDSAEAAARP